MLRHAFSGALSPAWDETSLADLGVGAWARPLLLALDAALRSRSRRSAPSADDTVRLVLRARDGALIETVIIPRAEPDDALRVEPGRLRAGVHRSARRAGSGSRGSFEAGEIVDQVRIAREVWRSRRGTPPLQNLVFMGMGEPSSTTWAR